MGRDCHTCKSKRVDMRHEPCLSCNTPDTCGGPRTNWEPEDEPTPATPVTNTNPGMTGQYTFRGGIEPMDFIRSNKLDFFEGNVVKYIYRYPHKGGVEALKKAKVYIDQLIMREEGK